MIRTAPLPARDLRRLGLGAWAGLVHLGLREAPKRSSLAYANEHRPWQLYQEVFYQLLSEVPTGKSSTRPHLAFPQPLAVPG